jgi:membrane-bound lytic murein transglycosylase A
MLRGVSSIDSRIRAGRPPWARPHSVRRNSRSTFSDLCEVRRFRLALLAGLSVLVGCIPRAVTPPPEPTPPTATPSPTPTPVPDNAVLAGVRPGPAITSIYTGPKASAALAAFRISCPSLITRTDQSGLTRPGDWRAACDAAPAWTADPAGFFAAHFESVEVGQSGNAHITGYFEPEIRGSRTPGPDYPVPVYRMPPDLVEQDQATAEATGTPRRGRLVDGRIVPYYERAEIVNGALAGQGLEIAYAADEIEFFFLQIQGSGRLLLPDGNVMRIGYAGQNGREYVGIGRLMRDRGLLQPGQTSMQGIVAWLRANPEEGRAIMNENKSYIFFKELTGPGPLGALGRPVTPRVTVAADPKFVPLGAPVILAVDRPEANGLWIAQDTGGAIKGANRFDTFWGAGDYAATTAGGMSARGRAFLLLPKGSLARLGSTGAPAAQR